MPAAYGWRAKVGKLNPTVIAGTFIYEFYKVAPPGVMLLTRNLAVRDVREQADRPDALYFPSSSWPTVEYVEYLGQDIGIPVVSGALAAIWNCLRTLNIHEPICGYGKLLSTL